MNNSTFVSIILKKIEISLVQIKFEATKTFSLAYFVTSSDQNTLRIVDSIKQIIEKINSEKRKKHAETVNGNCSASREQHKPRN
ncbi:hypothetical protein H744_1c1656 [Photobacterium gaetbulicola Gung47]|uniref:Uncharacterized protein n=1 Tax=Photobacterium gaetbulicola Gung47 TaxID=658445 RepID=A0A0C5WNN5_9GAMM|nr:hypothetical protein H744_1c1656 [Photobacterium gaetbulicola Gung47]